MPFHRPGEEEDHLGKPQHVQHYPHEPGFILLWRSPRSQPRKRSNNGQDHRDHGDEHHCDQHPLRSKL